MSVLLPPRGSLLSGIPELTTRRLTKPMLHNKIIIQTMSLLDRKMSLIYFLQVRSYEPQRWSGAIMLRLLLAECLHYRFVYLPNQVLLLQEDLPLSKVLLQEEPSPNQFHNDRGKLLLV